MKYQAELLVMYNLLGILVVCVGIWVASTLAEVEQ